MSNAVSQAFNIGANSTASESSILILSFTFASLLMVIAYIALYLFKELKDGKLKVGKFLAILLKMSFLFAILSYFLLRK